MAVKGFQTCGNVCTVQGGGVKGKAYHQDMAVWDLQREVL